MAEQQQQNWKSCRDCGLKISWNTKHHTFEDFGTFNRHECKSYKPRPSPIAITDINTRLENLETLIRENHIAINRELVDIKKAIRNE
jgi:hypothetical protein